MPAKLPEAVMHALEKGKWGLSRCKHHLVYQRTVCNKKQTLVIGLTPRANNHGGGHAILSTMKKLDREVGFGDEPKVAAKDGIAYVKHGCGKGGRLAKSEGKGRAKINQIVTNIK